LRRNAAGTLSFAVSVDGTAETTVTSTGTTIPATTWTWVAGRFDPSTELKCWINWESWTNTSSIPASIFDSTSNFVVGSADNPTDAMTGRTSLVWAAASLVSDSIVNQLFEQSRVAYGVLS
jgi:type II secretory pathway pseudopilin PulG